jgi:hypothetical protein
MQRQNVIRWRAFLQSAMSMHPCIHFFSKTAPTDGCACAANARPEAGQGNEPHVVHAAEAPPDDDLSDLHLTPTAAVAGPSRATAAAAGGTRRKEAGGGSAAAPTAFDWSTVAMALPPLLPPTTAANALLPQMLAKLRRLLEPSPFWDGVSTALCAAEAAMPAADDSIAAVGSAANAAAAAEMRAAMPRKLPDAVLQLQPLVESYLGLCTASGVLPEHAPPRMGPAAASLAAGAPVATYDGSTPAVAVGTMSSSDSASPCGPSALHVCVLSRCAEFWTVPP